MDNFNLAVFLLYKKNNIIYFHNINLIQFVPYFNFLAPCVQKDNMQYMIKYFSFSDFRLGGLMRATDIPVLLDLHGTRLIQNCNPNSM